jgi:glutamine amidotransferase
MKRKPEVGVLDYGMGNLRSVAKALEAAGAAVTVTDSRAVLSKSDFLVLPGQGAFGTALDVLRRKNLTDFVKNWLVADRPYLGICLGLQLLFEGSEEAPGKKGLGILKGRVRKFPSGSVGRKVPHMGWNQIVQGPGAREPGQRACPLLEGIPEKSFVYFVHSYYADPTDRSVSVLETQYAVRFTSMVWRENLYATQFHPEKSQAIGLTLLENFIKL